MSNSKNNFLIGKILTTHNLNGNVKLLSYAENPEEIFQYKLYDKNNNFMECKKVGLTSKRDTFLAKFKGIDSVEEARKYRDLELFVDRNELKELEEDEIYINDLIGMKVNGEGKIGKVENLYNYGASDVIEIRWDNNKLESIPFNDDFVKEIRDGVVYINLPKYI